MRKPLPILIVLFLLLAGVLYWRHLQSPDVREARLRSALENHNAPAAERILNP